MIADTRPLLDLGERVRAVRDASGWNRCTWANIDRKLTCVLAELQELEDELRCQPVRSECVAEELADAALYMVSIVADMRGAGAPSRSGGTATRYGSPPELTAMIREEVLGAWRVWRRSPDAVDDDAVIGVEIALLRLSRLACALDVDLRSACEAKLEKNAARPARHGGKHPDT